MQRVAGVRGLPGSHDVRGRGGRRGERRRIGRALTTGRTHQRGGDCKRLVHMTVQPRRSSLRPAAECRPLTGVAGWLIERLLVGRPGAPRSATEPELAVRQPSVRRAAVTLLMEAKLSLARLGEELAAEAAAAAAARAVSRARASRATSFRTESTTPQAQKHERTGLDVSSSSRPACEGAPTVGATSMTGLGTCDWKPKGAKAKPGMPARGRVSGNRGTMAEREMSCL